MDNLANAVIDAALYKSVLVLLLMASLCLIPGVNRSLAVQLGTEVSGGYDSNAALTDEETGSGFARYRLWVTQPFLQSNNKLNGSGVIQGVYQDFFDISDNYRISAGADLRWHLDNKKIIPTFMGEAVVFRNKELPEDDVSAVLLGSRLQWLATSRLTLGGYQSISLRDNAAAAEAGSGFGMGIGGAGSPGPHGSRGKASDASGNLTKADKETGILSQSRLESTWYILPSFTVDLTVAHNRMFSSENTAEYTENGFIATLRFEAGENWIFTGQAAYWDTEYDIGDFEEDTWIMDLWASRYIDKWELFALARWLDKEASATIDTYQQKVIECGVSRKF